MNRYTRMLVLTVLALTALPAATALSAAAALAGKVIVLGGTCWHTDAAAQLKLQKLGSIKDVVGLDLYLGPNAHEGLGAGEFELTDEYGDAFTGTWSDPTGSGDVILDFDPDQFATALADEVTALLQEKFGVVSDTFLDVTDLQVQIKLKSGKAGSFSLKVDFTGGATIGDVTRQIAGSLTAKGKISQYPRAWPV